MDLILPSLSNTGVNLALTGTSVLDASEVTGATVSLDTFLSSVQVLDASEVTGVTVTPTLISSSIGWT